MKSTIISICLCWLATFLSASSTANAQQSLLTDLTGDKNVTYLAFGDSLTSGVGDGIEPGKFVDSFDIIAKYVGGGYPARVAALSGITVDNMGIPGENFLGGGVDRFPSALVASSADLVGIMEGSNDAIRMLEPSYYQRLMQRVVNVALASGRTPILMTIPPPCCNHDGLTPFVSNYNVEVRELASANQVPMVDLERAWATTCEDKEACELFNLPEGEHPNKRGYDVIAQTVLATLYGIDIFSVGGAKQLEDALGLSEGAIIVKPDIAINGN